MWFIIKHSIMVVYTKHVEEKLLLPEIRKLEISKDKIEQVLGKPEVVDKSEKPVFIAIGELSKELSLSVVYKKIKKGLKVIIFYHAESGRYEHKVLQRG